MNVAEYISKTPEGCFELIGGIVREPPTPGYEHQSYSHHLDYIISTYVQRKSLGIVLTAPMDVVLDEELVVQPDILFISNKNQKTITKQNIQGPPDLVVEVVSPSSLYHDTVTKKAIYEKYGVREFWLVYPQEKVIEIFILKNNKFILHQSSVENTKLTSTVLQGFSIKVKNVFY